MAAAQLLNPPLQRQNRKLSSKLELRIINILHHKFLSTFLNILLVKKYTHNFLHHPPLDISLPSKNSPILKKFVYLRFFDHPNEQSVKL